MEKKKIKEVMILSEDDKFYQEKYAWFTYEDGTEDVMVYEDAIKYLQKYSLLNRFKNVDSLFTSFKTTVKTMDEFINNDMRFHSNGNLLEKIKRDKKIMADELGKGLGIKVDLLSSMYNLKGKPNADEILAMYEKIKKITLEECEKSGIPYEKDQQKIIGGVFETLKKSKYSVDEYAGDQEALANLYQRKIEAAKEEEYGFYFTNVERDFTALKMSMVGYCSDMFSSSYQLINALTDKKCSRRKEILSSWAEFMLVLPEYIGLINKADEYSSQANKEKLIIDIEKFHANSEFMGELEALMDHDPERETYRYHATSTLDNGLSILEKGLFLSGRETDSTSYAEFSIDEVLTYKYGGVFNSVGDYIVVFREPKSENIVRETTEEERENNPIFSRRMVYSAPTNNYIIDPKYMVGLIDRQQQKVYSVKEKSISLENTSIDVDDSNVPKAR